MGRLVTGQFRSVYALRTSLGDNKYKYKYKIVKLTITFLAW